MGQINTIKNKIRLRVKAMIEYIGLYFWWVKSRNAENRILLELSRSAAATIGVKPFKKIKIAYTEDVINAAAVGFLCRTLVISQGMLNILTLDELQAVIFHEYAHCRRKHHLKLAASSLSVMFIEALPYLYIALNMESEAVFFTLTVVFFALIYVSTLLFTRYLTRKFEEEADITVVEMLENPRIYLQVLQKIAVRSSTGRMGLVERLFSSHPPPAERLRKLYTYLYY
ncbi:MAG: M48 family metallopeptidase [Ignisphaera sp.]|nr:M48 family metallopeptidase [Ignisphaera sp.]MCX8168346.1 M48 family metallopeptidase [Ignisphaera sp.]MDW8085321.1 M48 family metalloprotease [Ignisphaera sp.]